MAGKIAACFAIYMVLMLILLGRKRLRRLIKPGAPIIKVQKFQ